MEGKANIIKRWWFLKKINFAAIAWSSLRYQKTVYYNGAVAWLNTSFLRRSFLRDTTALRFNSIKSVCALLCASLLLTPNNRKKIIDYPNRSFVLTFVGYVYAHFNNLFLSFVFGYTQFSVSSSKIPNHNFFFLQNINKLYHIHDDWILFFFFFSGASSAVVHIVLFCLFSFQFDWFALIWDAVPLYLVYICASIFVWSLDLPHYRYFLK